MKSPWLKKNSMLNMFLSAANAWAGAVSMAAMASNRGILTSPISPMRSRTRKGESNRSFCNRMQPLSYQTMRCLTMDDMAHLVIEWHLTSPHPLAECPN
jgi:hypothetical protein